VCASVDPTHKLMQGWEGWWEGDEIEKGRRVRGRLVTACNVRQSGSCVHVDTQSGGFRGDEAYLFFKLKQNAAQQKWNNSWSGCAVEDQSWVPVGRFLGPRHPRGVTGTQKWIPSRGREE
jgi:hypothetical protein